MRAEIVRFFVQNETGRFGRDLEKNAARFAEIDRMKINAIDYRSHVVSEFNEMLAPLQLLGIVLGAEGDVMHRPGRNVPGPTVWHAKQINNSAWTRFARRNETKTIS